MQRKCFSFDRPTPKLICDYNILFDEDNEKADWYKDNALIKLFSLMPNNNKIEEVLTKVTVLNTFYGTQILDKDLLDVAQTIIDLKIDQYFQVDNKDVSIVNRIAYSDCRKYKKNLYSFASKYCSFHKPQKFPIADSYAKGMLYYMNNDPSYRFTDHFIQIDLNNYVEYCRIYLDFIRHYNLDKDDFTFKTIDKYLWKYAKVNFGEAIQITNSGYRLSSEESKTS